MKKLVMLLFLSLFILVSCEESDSNIDMVKRYYEILNSHDSFKISEIINDSVLTTEIDYKKTFSREEYMQFLKWDAVFKPEYKILEIKKEGDLVKAKVTHKDLRLGFLHEQPVVTNQVFKFNNNKITAVKTVKYVVFNDSVFVKNRTKLLNFVDKAHPELKGFLHDQTEKGALKYLKAVNLYHEEN